MPDEQHGPAGAAQPRALTYASHLRLDRILGAQQPVSGQPDEMLFIIVHQTSELWLKLILAEIDRARTCLAGDRIRPALKALDRVIVVFGQLVAGWDVLRTLDPTEFRAFRGSLGTASGVQSCQYRLVEYALGNRVVTMLDAHAPGSAERALLEAELARPSLYHLAIDRLAERLGVPLPDGGTTPRGPHKPDPAVEDAWRQVYQNAAGHPDLFELAERLVSVEDRFRCWRFNHVTTVERVIGHKRGTGGTSGVGYLRTMLEVELFPELWRLRAAL
ncbi:tryptophan 2,3-dioxygenase [Tropicimonas sp.]|uniref:tryptophan 2,3-dioxygenase n=1 Tax=Tropicimonas sp. TaxID=2067044 RepID=UPI003A8A9A91